VLPQKRSSWSTPIDEEYLKKMENENTYVDFLFEKLEEKRLFGILI